MKYDFISAVPLMQQNWVYFSLISKPDLLNYRLLYVYNLFPLITNKSPLPFNIDSYIIDLNIFRMMEDNVRSI